MQTKTSTILITSCLVLVLLAGAFAGGIFIGWAIPREAAPAAQIQPLNPNATAAPAEPTATASSGGSARATLVPTKASPTQSATAQSTTNTDLLFKPFWEAWSLVHQQYVDQPVDDTKLMQGAIKGMLDSLGDSHTAYSDPAAFAQETNDLSGQQQYEGIGAWVDPTGAYLKIISPMPNSPAEKAGIRSGDVIVAVDKADVTGISGDLVLKKVLGPAGSTVVLTIKRGNADPIDISIVRAKIDVPQTEAHMEKNNIAYIRLFIYGDKTAGELHQALLDLLAKKPAGLILDLRDNGGGLLESAIDVLSEFVPYGKIVMYEQYGNGQKVSHASKGNGLATDGSIPIIILVNAGTASASEITAGALQDMKLARLVGVKTYGKGSVQLMTPLAGNQGGVRITVAHWMTPNGRQINGVGLTPDVEVQITADDIKAGADPQLQKAIDLLSGK